MSRAGIGYLLRRWLVVLSNYSIRRGKPTDSDCLRIAFADAYDSLSAALRHPPKPSRQGLAATRTHCPSPSAVGARAQTDGPVPADPHRSVLVGLALSFVARLLGRRRHRQAGHRYSLAPKGLSVVLDMEVQAATTGTPAGAPRGQGVDPANEPRERAMGRTAHSRRALEAGDRDQPGYGVQLHGPPSPPAVTDLADLPRQPCGRTRLDRSVRRPDRYLSSALCLHRVAP